MGHRKLVVSSVHMHRAWQLWGSVQWASWAIFLQEPWLSVSYVFSLALLEKLQRRLSQSSCGSDSPYYHYSGNKMSKMAGDLNILNVNIVWPGDAGGEDWRYNCFLKGLLLSYLACRSTFIPTSIGSLMSSIPEHLGCFWLSSLVAFNSSFSALLHQLSNMHLLSSFQMLLLLSSLLLSSLCRFMCCFSGVSGGTRD